MAGNVTTNFVIKIKKYQNGLKYYCVYDENQTKLLLLTTCIKMVSAITGKKYGHWGINR